jgi:hypothetical protein
LVRRCEMCSRKKLSAMTTETQTTLPTTASEMRAKMMEIAARLRSDSNKGPLQAPSRRGRGRSLEQSQPKTKP